MKSFFIFKLFLWAFAAAFCASIWAYIIMQPVVLLVYAAASIAGVILSYSFMRSAKRQGL